MNKKELVIVAGAAGEIGSEYCKQITDNKIDCIAIIRKKKLEFKSKYLRQVVCNLEDDQEINKAFSKINFSKYDKIIYLHTIGVDKFDPRGYPKVQPMNTIDPVVYNTNVNSFKHLLKFCLRKISIINQNKVKTHFRIAIIAGVSDKYTPFVIESFCEAKFILRQYIQSYINLYSSWVSGLSINISSTITMSALKVRPHANTKYWLTPKEVVKKSYKKLMSGHKSYSELDIIKYYPEFIEDYYENNHLLYKKWSQETGIF